MVVLTSDKSAAKVLLPSCLTISGVTPTAITAESIFAIRRLSQLSGLTSATAATELKVDVVRCSPWRILASVSESLQGSAGRKYAAQARTHALAQQMWVSDFERKSAGLWRWWIARRQRLCTNYKVSLIDGVKRWVNFLYFVEISRVHYVEQNVPHGFVKQIGIAGLDWDEQL